MPKRFDIYAELGLIGVAEYSGKLSDRYATVLQGPGGIQKMARVLRREPAAYTAWSMVTLAAKSVHWYVIPTSEAKADQICADFVQSCMTDMSTSWLYAIKFAMSAWAFGWADLEIVWKKRLGQNPGRGLPPSKWDDGLVGMRKLAIRRQETVYEWINDAMGGKGSLRQQDPNTGRLLDPIPIEKLLHFVGGDDRGSWEGMGWLEPAYWVAYLIEQLEQIGGTAAQRGSTGLPVFKFLQIPDNTTLSIVDEIGEGLTANELQYVKLPGPVVDFDFKTVSLSNLDDIRGWIGQLRWEISALLAATFIRLGSTERGTQALAATVYDAFTSGIDGCLDDVQDVLNRHLVPRLLANNPGEFGGISDHPQIQHSKVTHLPPATVQWLDKVQAWLDGADSADVEWLRAIFAMPYRSARDIQRSRDAARRAEEAKQAAEKQAKEQTPAGGQPVPPAPSSPPQPSAPSRAPQPKEQPGPKAEAGAEQPGTQAREFPAAVREALLMAAQRVLAGRHDDADMELIAHVV
jgi:hypothetical protein